MRFEHHGYHWNAPTLGVTADIIGRHLAQLAVAALAVDDSITLLVNNIGTTHVREVVKSHWQNINNVIQLNVRALTR